MEGQQARTFLPYLRGIPSEALRLGSLYINPLEPNDGLASKRFEYRRDIKDDEEYDKHIKEWTWKEERDEKPDQPFSIDFDTTQGGSLGLGFTEWMRIKGEHNKTIHVTIEGVSGRRLKIRDPEAFLEEVMTQPLIDQWIRKQASITYRGRYSRNRWKAPEIWMVTGVQYITGASLHYEGSASKKLSGEAGGDLSSVAGAPPGTLKVKAEASRERSNGAKNDFGHGDERVWAAQFMPVTLEFGPQEDTSLTLQQNGILPKTVRQFRLEDVPDMKARGIRASQEQSNDSESQLTPPPKLIGRVITKSPAEDVGVDGGVADEEGPEGEKEGEKEDPEGTGIVIDDTPYVAAVEEADWGMYEDCSKYLADAERRRRLVGREQEALGRSEAGVV